jgi:DinB superfamily
MTDLRYPIGKFEWTPPASDEQSAKDRAQYIDVLAKLPALMRAAVQGLRPEQLDTPYRSEGFKLALTEEQPPVKPYDEAAWAQLSDSSAPIEVSLQLLAALHSRWVDVLQGMKPSDFGRTLYHPEHGVVTLDRMLAMYAWHAGHHLAHITSLRERMGWKQRAAAQH